MRNLFHRAAPSAALALLLVASATPASAQPENRVNFDLHEGSLARSLREVATRTGQNLIAPDELVRPHRAPPLSGTFTAKEAVERLILGTGLRSRAVNGTVVIEADPPARDAAGEHPGDDPDRDVVVTGTHVRGSSPTSPLVVISREDIERSGATSVDEIMRNVPQNSRGGVNKENSLVALPDQDVTDHGAGINLRGLGQRATLVLLNGRRLAPSGNGSFVDVSMIPVSVIERVEILTDGASAIYGSDAVGGVVNFVLRDRIRGFETSAQFGTSTRGGGGQAVLAQSAGARWNGGGGLLSYEFRAEDEVRAGDRSFTVNLRPDTALLPKERRHSLLGTLEQDLAPGLSAGLTATFADRSTERTVFQSISPLPIGVEAEATSAALSGEVRYELPGGWLARFGGTASLSTSSQLQTQPGGIEIVNSRDVRNAMAESELRADGTVFNLPAGPVRVALGAQVRLETYRDGFESSAFAPSVRKARRTIGSMFGEIHVPIVSSANRQPGLERLQLSAAARYERYEGTGSSFDPKVGVLWSPVPGLDLRGSFSTSFRAPLLSEVTGAYNALYLPASLLYADPSQAPAGSIALFLQGSNPDVKPETSRNWTIGADWKPAQAPGLELGLNFYAIRFSDRIALPAPVVNVIGDPAFDPIVDRTPDAAGVAAILAQAQSVFDFSGPGFTNGGATPADVDVVLDDRVSNTAITVTSGFDASMRYAFDLGRHSFAVDGSVTRIVRFDQQLTSASPLVQALNRPYRPLRWRGRAALNWGYGAWNASFHLNHAGDYRDDRSAPMRRIRSYTTADAHLSYTFANRRESWLDGTKVSLFAENLFDSAPPRLAPDPGSANGLGYDPVNASGRGRFVAIQLRRSW